jgi:hypothetical protein
MKNSIIIDPIYHPHKNLTKIPFDAFSGKENVFDGIHKFSGYKIHRNDEADLRSVKSTPLDDRLIYSSSRHLNCLIPASSVMEKDNRSSYEPFLGAMFRYRRRYRDGSEPTLAHMKMNNLHPYDRIRPINNSTSSKIHCKMSRAVAVDTVYLDQTLRENVCFWLIDMGFSYERVFSYRQLRSSDGDNTTICEDDWRNGVILSEISAVLARENKSLIKEVKSEKFHGRFLPKRLMIIGTEPFVRSIAQVIHNLQR